MTRTLNARLAGVTFLLYIVTGITSMVAGRSGNGVETTAMTLARIAVHPASVWLGVLLSLLSAAYALVLGVTLYALTRDQDPDLARLALCCRAAEGLISAISPLRLLALLAIATAGAGTAQETAAGHVLAALLLKMGGWSTLIAATCFAAGSSLFSYLFLRARSVPAPIAWLGLISSLLLVLVLPLQLVGLLEERVASLTWLPVLVFELALALWLIVRGVVASRRVRSPQSL